MAGYIEVWTTAKPPVHRWIWGRVHPDYEGLGIGTWMLQWGEVVCASGSEGCFQIFSLCVLRRVLVFIAMRNNLRNCYEDMGYHYIRSSYRMLIEMDSPVPEPIWA